MKSKIALILGAMYEPLTEFEVVPSIAQNDVCGIDSWEKF